MLTGSNNVQDRGNTHEAENPRMYLSTTQPNVIVFVSLKRVYYVNVISIRFLLVFNLKILVL